MDNVYYVYVHNHPKTNETVYVGKGCYGRAWDVTRNRNGHPDHLSWMKTLCEEGYLPYDWVWIIHKGLSEKEAFEKEKEYLHKHGTTRFNRQSGERNNKAKLTDTQALNIYDRCLTGESKRKIAIEFGVSPSAVHMIANRKQWKAVTACRMK